MASVLLRKSDEYDSVALNELVELAWWRGDDTHVLESRGVHHRHQRIQRGDKTTSRPLCTWCSSEGTTAIPGPERAGPLPHRQFRGSLDRATCVSNTQMP